MIAALSLVLVLFPQGGLPSRTLQECEKRGGVCVEEADCYGRRGGGEECRGAAAGAAQVCCLHSGIAQTKCLEYKEEAMKEEEENGGGAVAVGVGGGGGRRAEVEAAQCSTAGLPLIVGGTAASQMEFPHAVAIGFGLDWREKGKWFCGGSLLSHDWVLTAAHCLSDGSNGVPRWAAVGAVERLSEEEGEEGGGGWKQVERVAKRVRHPRYKRWAHLNDLALLRLAGPLRFTPAVRPLCLASRPPPPDTHLVAVGWGNTGYGSKKGSDSLMKVGLGVVPDCDRYFLMLKGGVPPSIICSGHLPGGKDTCQGDSGGPLQMAGEGCGYVQVGVTSTGGYCGFPNSPALYTNVPYFLSWIESVVWASDH